MRIERDARMEPARIGIGARHQKDASQELHERLGWWANTLGLTGSPFDSYLTLRGMRTLHARLAVHGRNAQGLAEFLAAVEQPRPAEAPAPTAGVKARA